MTSTDSLLKTVVVVIAVLLAFPLMMMVFMMPMMGMVGWGHMWNGGMWDGGTTWMWVVMWPAMLLLLFGGGYALYRALTSPGSEEKDDAIEALRVAYARGELSDEEFEERRQRLQSDG